MASRAIFIFYFLLLFRFAQATYTTGRPLSLPGTVRNAFGNQAKIKTNAMLKYSNSAQLLPDNLKPSVGSKWTLKAEQGGGTHAGGSATKREMTQRYRVLMSLARGAPSVGTRWAFEERKNRDAQLIEGTVTQAAELRGSTRILNLDFEASVWQMYPDEERGCFLKHSGNRWDVGGSTGREFLGPVKASADTSRVAHEYIREHPHYDYHDNNSRTFIRQVYAEIKDLTTKKN